MFISFALCKTYAQDQSQKTEDNFYYEADASTSFHELCYNDDGSIRLGQQRRNFFPLEFKIIHSSPVTVNGKKYFEISFYMIKDEGSTEVQSKDGASMECLKGNTYFINSAKDNNRYFLIEADTLLSDSSIRKFITPHTSFVYGANFSSPFKFRPAVGNINYIFSPEVDLGGYVGWKIPIEETQTTFLTFAFSSGFSSIQINNQDINNPSTNPNNGTAWGVSESFGLILQTKDVQIGALWGHDLVSGEMGKNWLYNGMPWYSFSIGYSFVGGTKSQTNKINKETEAARSTFQDLSKNAGKPIVNREDIKIQQP